MTWKSWPVRCRATRLSHAMSSDASRCLTHSCVSNSGDACFDLRAPPTHAQHITWRAAPNEPTPPFALATTVCHLRLENSGFRRAITKCCLVMTKPERGRLERDKPRRCFCPFPCRPRPVRGDFDAEHTASASAPTSWLTSDWYSCRLIATISGRPAGPDTRRQQAGLKRITPSMLATDTAIARASLLFACQRHSLHTRAWLAGLDLPSTTTRPRARSCSLAPSSPSARPPTGCPLPDRAPRSASACIELTTTKTFRRGRGGEKAKGERQRRTARRGRGQGCCCCCC